MNTSPNKQTNNSSKTTAAVIVAAGRGTRAGSGLAKQWRPLAGQRVADWTVQAFTNHPLITRVIVVVNPLDLNHYASLGLQCVAGGTTRDASVRAGLEALQDAPPDQVLIHDVARACITESCITKVIMALNDAPGSAPAIAITDALWRGENAKVVHSHPRDGLFRAQTPQGFHYNAILTAHQNHTGTALDDVGVAQAAGIDVSIVPGDEDNLKITTPDDFARAEHIIQRGKMDIRLGNGFDVHAFEDGTSVTLCGVNIPHTRALKGHSDADVGMHAVTDALYGAMAEGDIGRHFPPSEAQWKNADSAIFLDHAVKLATQKGYRIGNIDCTLICEHPKIGPHATLMMDRMAQIMGLRPDQVSIKATTSERLGFTGREEGIAALATATLVKS
jgi:2-C-methyl-D-erythritol 4-phosphate cytidylyltransferase/2-C-methyl-D-erythritol 2,4-cyclodiphosphate synthase